METIQIRDQIQVHVDRLSDERLRVALDFLTYLADKEEAEEEEATQELLAIPNFKENLLAAEKRADAGELIDWETIRDDV